MGPQRTHACLYYLKSKKLGTLGTLDLWFAVLHLHVCRLDCNCVVVEVKRSSCVEQKCLC